MVHLTVPDLSDAVVIERKAGVRPCRSELRLEAEMVGSGKKLVFHNYGHGGVGLSLAWGCALKVAELLGTWMWENERPSIVDKGVAVIGSGIIGLTTAHMLKDAGYDVTIYAENFPPHTTSNVASGMWTPSFAQGSKATSKKIQERDEEIREFSFRCLKKNADAKALEEKPPYEGVRWVDFYDFTENPVLEEKEMLVEVQFGDGKKQRAYKTKKILMDTPVYINAVYNDAKFRGIKFVKQRLNCLEDVCGFTEDVIINCTGFGAKVVCDDKEMIPVRGQLVHVLRSDDCNKKVDYAIRGGLYPDDTQNHSKQWISMFPWNDRLVIGGVFEDGEDQPVVDEAVCADILQKAREFFAILS